MRGRVDSEPEAGDSMPCEKRNFLSLNRSEIILYNTEDGQGRIQVRLEGGTVWLPQPGMVELYQTTKQNVSLHIQNIYEEWELAREATVKHCLTVQTEGSRKITRSIEFYNLDMILSLDNGALIATDARPH